MSCGCGGECCRTIQGLGALPSNVTRSLPAPVLAIRARRSGMRGLGFLDWTGDSGEYYYEDDYGNWQYWGADGSYYEGGIGGDWAGWDASGTVYNPSWWDAPLESIGTSASYGQGANSNWQGLLDWWDRFTGQQSAIQEPSGSGYDERGLPGYCPAGYYHPLNDPYICVPFPAETAAQKAQRQKAQQQQAQQQQQKKQQQAQQPCPPNTGLTKNAQGQCVCPNGYTFSKTYQKCVLVSQLTAEDRKALEGSDLWKYLAIGAFVLIAIKAVK